MSRGSIDAHRQTQNGVTKGVPVQEGDREGGSNDLRKYMMFFPSKLGPRTYPVEGCSCWTEMRTTMRMHFWHRLVRDTVVIMEEGNLPHAR